MLVGEANSINGTQIKPLTVINKRGRSKDVRLMMPFELENNTLGKRKSSMRKVTQKEKKIQRSYWNDVKNTMTEKTFTWMTDARTASLDEEAINTILKQF